MFPDPYQGDKNAFFLMQISFNFSMAATALVQVVRMNEPTYEGGEKVITDLFWGWHDRIIEPIMPHVSESGQSFVRDQFKAYVEDSIPQLLEMLKTLYKEEDPK